MRFGLRNVIVLVILLSAESSWSSVSNRLEDKQVKIMYWPELEFKKSFQIDFELSSVDEKVNNGQDGSEMSVKEMPTYAISLGAGLLTNLRGGIQFGPTRMPLLNLSLNFNLQYDLYKSENNLIAFIGMYGGVFFPGERYGGKLLLSHKIDDFIYYFTFERMKSYRYFQYGTTVLNSFVLYNSLEYNLVSDLSVFGIRTSKVGELLGNKDVSIDINIGYSKDVDLHYFNARFEPANFHRTDGLILSSSWIFFF